MVKSSTNVSYSNINGIIVDETKNTFIVDCGGEKKCILKKGTTFTIDSKTVQGDTIIKRLENRIKTRRS